MNHLRTSSRRDALASRRAFVVAVWAFVAAVTASCRDDGGLPSTRTTVRIDADAGVRGASASLHVVVSGGAGVGDVSTVREDRVYALGAGGGDLPMAALPMHLTLAPRDGDATRAYRVEVTALDPEGRTVASARLIGSFIAGRALVAQLVLEDDCRSTECTSDTTCSAGTCVDARVDPMTLAGECPEGEGWFVDRCVPAGECGATAACGAHASCAGAGSGFLCDCDPGYGGDGETCSNPCAPSPCVHGSGCTPVRNTYTCGTCDPGWTGKNCDAPVVCSGLANPAHGTVSATSASPLGVVSYACGSGYVLVGNGGRSFRTCLFDGTWSGSEPTCEVPSSPCTPNPCANGGTCVEASNSYSCTCVAGSGFSGPTCASPVMCSGAASPGNGMVSATTTTYPNSVTFTCDTGYMRNGASYAECLADGTFSAPTPTCDPVVCTGAAPPLHGTVSSTSIPYPNLVSYACDAGYVRNGPGYATCLANGSWSASPPTCDPIVCTGAAAPAYGTVSSTSVAFPGTVTYWCNEGCARNGSLTAQCQANGSWSTAPTCGPRQIASGDAFTCALLADGTVRCFGSNAANQLGAFNQGDPVYGLTSVVAIAAGGAHACGLLSSGTIACWGSDNDGQLGDAGAAIGFKPVAVQGITTATAIAAGTSHTCAVLADGTARCWGDNFRGKLGTGTTSPASTPAVVSGLSGARMVAAGDDHTCALHQDGTVSCWGDGFGLAPVKVSAVSGAVSIGTGTGISCALLATGGVVCWGNNVDGQLGTGSTQPISSAAPLSVTGVTNATALSVGASHACVVLSDATTRCWGANMCGSSFGSCGRLGNGTTSTNSATPVAVTGLSSVAAIGAGASHTCAILSDGTGRCWGLNGDGQLGNGGSTDTKSPVAVTVF